MGGGSQFPPLEEAADSESGTYHFLSRRTKTQHKDPTVEATQYLNQSISNIIDKRLTEGNQVHLQIWMQLEKLFEQLPEDVITELNFKYVSMAYEAILKRRELS